MNRDHISVGRVVKNSAFEIDDYFAHGRILANRVAHGKEFVVDECESED